MKKSTYKFLASLLAGLIVSRVGFAQDPPAFGDNVTDLVPLDGGLFALLGAGVALCVKKSFQSRKGR